MSVGDERHRYQSAAAVVGTIVEAKAGELLRQLGEVQQSVLADVQRRASAVIAVATRRVAGTAQTVVAWSSVLAAMPFGAGRRPRDRAPETSGTGSPSSGTGSSPGTRP